MTTGTTGTTASTTGTTGATVRTTGTTVAAASTAGTTRLCCAGTAGAAARAATGELSREWFLRGIVDRSDRRTPLSFVSSGLRARPFFSEAPERAQVRSRHVLSGSGSSERECRPVLLHGSGEFWSADVLLRYLPSTGAFRSEVVSIRICAGVLRGVRLLLPLPGLRVSPGVRDGVLHYLMSLHLHVAARFQAHLLNAQPPVSMESQTCRAAASSKSSCCSLMNMQHAMRLPNIFMPRRSHAYAESNTNATLTTTCILPWSSEGS